MKKTILCMALSGLIGVAFTPGLHAGQKDVRHDRRDVRHDKRDKRHDRKNLRHDRG